MAIANARDLGAIKMNIGRTIVEHDEIVARAVHFRKTQHARFRLAQSPPKANRHRCLRRIRRLVIERV